MNPYWDDQNSPFIDGLHAIVESIKKKDDPDLLRYAVELYEQERQAWLQLAKHDQRAQNAVIIHDGVIEDLKQYGREHFGNMWLDNNPST